MDFKKKVGQRIKILREQNDISNNRLAKIIGSSSGYISDMEAGRNAPSLEMLNKICSALNITLAEFFAEEVPEMPMELRQIMSKAKHLPPQKLKILNDVLDSWIEND